MDKKTGYDFWKHTLNSAKLVVAPMVDQSELAWRLLSRRYGAELCYTPMLHSSVFVRDANYRKEGLASCNEDRPLIVQFCGNVPEVILKAAKLAEPHIDAVDLNLGCPQAIARRGHYGAYLQEEWDLVEKIISLCASELKVPITAKIRVFEDVEKTVRYAQMLEKAGVQLLTVHGRTIDQKGVYTGLASWAHIKAVRENIKIPMFANGNIQYLSDVHRCIKETGVDGVMTAEGNLHSPGIFDGKDHIIWDMAEEYFEIVEKHPCPLAYVRGHVFKLFQHAIQLHTNVRDLLANSKTIEEIKQAVIMLKECSKEDMKKYARNPSSMNSSLPKPYWICQPYVRPNPNENEEPKRVKLINKDAELESLKRTLSKDQDFGEEALQDLSKNQLKKLKRNHRKVFITKATDEKFPKCGCGNPKGTRCVFECCKQCCREKAFREKLNCPGHKLFLKILMDGTDSQKKITTNSSGNRTLESEANSKLDHTATDKRLSGSEIMMDTEVENDHNSCSMDCNAQNYDNTCVDMTKENICDRDNCLTVKSP